MKNINNVDRKNVRKWFIADRKPGLPRNETCNEAKSKTKNRVPSSIVIYITSETRCRSRGRTIVRIRCTGANELYQFANNCCSYVNSQSVAPLGSHSRMRVMQIRRIQHPSESEKNKTIQGREQENDKTRRSDITNGDVIRNKGQRHWNKPTKTQLYVCM